MLRITEVALEVIREARPLVEAIGRHDKDLERQLRKSLTSVTSNLGEGSGCGAKGGRRPSHYAIALGSLQEAWMQLRTAEAWGYIVSPARPPSGGGPPRDAESSAWTPDQRDEDCSSGEAAGGTVTWPTGRRSSSASRRARVAAQYFGASSRYRSRGQYGNTRMISAR